MLDSSGHLTNYKIHFLVFVLLAHVFWNSAARNLTSAWASFCWCGCWLFWKRRAGLWREITVGEGHLCYGRSREIQISFRCPALGWSVFGFSSKAGFSKPLARREGFWKRSVFGAVLKVCTVGFKNGVRFLHVAASSRRFHICIKGKLSCFKIHKTRFVTRANRILVFSGC